MESSFQVDFHCNELAIVTLRNFLMFGTNRWNKKASMQERQEAHAGQLLKDVHENDCSRRVLQLLIPLSLNLFRYRKDRL
jgi:hypothetical protein